MNLYKRSYLQHEAATKSRKLTEGICILTASCYTANVVLFVCLMFRIGAADDVISQEAFYPELPRQVIIILLAGLVPAILSFRWLKLHP